MSETYSKRPVPASDDLTLIDLAIIFVNRRRVFYWVAGLVLFVGLGSALVLMPDVREYSTIIRLAEEDRKPVSSPMEIVFIVQTSWYPIHESQYQKASGNSKLPFKLAASNLEDTSLIQLVSKGGEREEALITDAHRFITDKVVKHQTEVLEMRRRAVQKELTTAQARVEELQESDLGGEAQATVVDTITKLKAQISELEYGLENLTPARATLVAHRGAEEQGVKKPLAVIVIIAFGLVFGVFSAFFVEFLHRVRGAFGNFDHKGMS